MKDRSDIDVLNEWYDSFYSFVQKYNNIFLSELDHYITKNLNLYAVYEMVDFAEIKYALEKLQASAPSINRIFGKPIIHLIEQDEVLPVESVRYINSKAIDHVASHFELWANVDEDGIKPRKLLSRTYTDNYSIYENVVFANSIDLMLYYIKEKVNVLDGLMFSLKLHDVNLLDRTNHLDYYLALGKLHTGYIRNYGRYLAEAGSLKDSLVKYYHKVSSRLYKKVYRLNKDKKITKLRKTNILAMDKDYRKIYSMYKFFDTYKTTDFLKKMSFDNPNYFWFCEILLLFSLEHFGFTEDERRTLDFEALDFDFSADKFHLNVKTISAGEKSILLTFKNDTQYRILLTPVCKYNEFPLVDQLAEETVYLTPMDSNNSVFVSITEIESFRRLQQVVLKGMVYSTENFDLCPFCLGPMEREGYRERYVCDSCKQVIEKKYCKSTNLPYYNTYIKDFVKTERPDEILDVEKRMNFRNINKLTATSYICPHCKKPH